MAADDFVLKWEDADAQAMLGRLADGAVNRRPIHAAIGSILEGSTRDRFDEQRGPDGIAWEDISPEWKEAKEQRGFSVAILIMRGDLRSSIASEPSDEDVLIRAGPAPYVAIHQFGGKGGMAPGPAAIPARPYMGVSEQDAADILDEARAWLANLAAG